ncbi:MAG: MauE/DoxX family redox-associated membrane protein [Ignavibacteriaceae bacterium]
MIKKILSNQYLLFLFRVILGLVFIYSGIIKIIDTTGFSDSIYNYKLLPDLLINFLAIVLPWIELITGLLLMLGITIKENALIINALLIIFLIAIIINLSRGLDINCGCFGTGNGTKIGFTKLVENSILLFMGAILMLFDSKILSIPLKKNS